MLDQTTRSAILLLKERGFGTRRIASAVGVSRDAVKEVLRSRSAEVPRIVRAELAEPHRDAIVDLFGRSKGNLVRVHEELVAAGADLSYQALTAFCRRNGIGHPPPEPAGRYTFAPGKEMQHDTSPHEAKIGGVMRRVQTASVVACHSHMIFMQLYPAFNRFTCKVFLTDAVRYFDGACEVCMIDNTHVVVLHGTGAQMVPVPEMAAFAERFGFVFKAHEKGDPNRSARVEGPFNFIDNNFLANRKFADWDDASRQAVAWCDKVNATYRSRWHGSPRDLFVAERAAMRRLPIWVPDVYALHHRIVDVEGYVTVHQNRYSAPYQLIGRRVEVRETKERIEVFDGPRLLAAHRRVPDPGTAHITLPEHRPPRRKASPAEPGVEERALLTAAPEIAPYVALLKTRASGRGTLALRRLFRMLRDYPRGAFLAAIRDAAHYGLYDLERLDRMVLRNIARDFFPVPDIPSGRDDDEDDDDDR